MRKVKIIIIGFLILFNNSIYAYNYYFSNGGSDANAGTINAPLQTIAKFNSIFITLVAGDSVLFNKGDIFYGSIKATRSGTLAAQINIGSYGAGANPIVTGLTTVTGFANIGGNIWESSAITTFNKPNLVLFNSVMKAMGRWPNFNYNYYSAFTATTYIKDAAITGYDFTGGRLCVRKLHDIISNDSITLQNIDTLFYTSISGYSTLANYGYFVENHPSTLDFQDEWYYNPTTKKISIYSSTMPTNIQISTVDTLCYLAQFDNITVSGISFQGANVAGVAFGGPSVGQAVRDTIKGCSFMWSGRDAIYCTWNQFCAIQNNSIYYSQNDGIMGENEGGQSLDLNVINNIIKHTGTLAGMGFKNASTSNNITYNAITIIGDNAVIKGNIIDTVGHVGIAGYNSGTRIRDNYINYHNFLTDDGGGINLFGGSAPIPRLEGLEVVNNVVSNGIGAAIGCPDEIAVIGSPILTGNDNVANGIYMDDRMMNVRIDSNVVINTANHGIYLHNTTNITMRRNTVINSGVSGFGIAHDRNVLDISIDSLEFVSNTITQNTGMIIYMYNFVNGGNLDSMFVKLDSNIYTRSFQSPDTSFYTSRITAGPSFPKQNINFTQWKVAYLGAINGPWDANSSQSIPLPPPVYIFYMRWKAKFI